MNDLLGTLEQRAGRASADPDVHDIVDVAVARGYRLVRRRRLTVAASSGALVLAAVAALVLLVLDPSPERSGSVPPAASRSVPTTAAPAAARLVAASPTPKSAPVSLGLLPDGWVRSGTTLAYASYARPGDRYADSPGSLSDKLVVAVSSSNGQHLRVENFPLHTGKYRAVYYPGRGDTGVSIYVSPSITIEIDIPASARLDKTQVLQLAASLTIRNTSNPVHG